MSLRRRTTASKGEAARAAFNCVDLLFVVLAPV
jgi:hypothetical protein